MKALSSQRLAQSVFGRRGGGRGHRVRLRFSSAFGGTPLPLTTVTVALPLHGGACVSAAEPGTTRRVTFSGEASTTVPAGLFRRF